ncbi:MAG TPA: hypothetical protein VLC46_04065 [Thermoanaerobaculia bacterium]|nr:hypothetical protein [Thermoanaerobaculia bacterium]
MTNRGMASPVSVMSSSYDVLAAVAAACRILKVKRALALGSGLVHLEELSAALPGFAEAMAWPGEGY